VDDHAPRAGGRWQYLAAALIRSVQVFADEHGLALVGG
jgi:hypothetical protein